QAAFERQRLLRIDLAARLSSAPNLPDDHPLARDFLITRTALRDLITLQTSGKGHLTLSRVRAHTIDPYAGLWIEGPQTLIRDHIIETPADAEAYIARMAALADGLQDTRRRLLADAATGHLPPRDILAATREQIERHLAKNAFEAILDTLETFSVGLQADGSSNHEARMLTAKQIYETDLLPAYRDLTQSLSELEKQAPIPLGLWTQPGGVTLYKDLLRVHGDETTSIDTLWPALETALISLAPDLEQVSDPAEGTENQAVKLSQTLFTAQQQKQDVTDVTNIAQRLATATPTTLSRARQPLVTSPFLGLHRLTARYDNRRPAILEFDEGRLTALPPSVRAAVLSKPYIEAKRIFETASEPAANRSIIRAYICDEAFEAAWLSYYQSTRTKNANTGHTDKTLQLKRLQVALAQADIGLHAKRWSLDQARDALIDTTGLSPDLAEEAVLRLAANPGVAVGTYVHAERFRSLETRARQVLGPRFDLSSFQTVLLSEGPRPLALVERDIETWYESLIEAP
ncbi:MAG: DUF885 family protein, partial [Pseudomonadota bacterium]